MRAIIVVDAGKQAASNRAAARVDTAGGDGTFTVPLAESSDPTTTVAYWCSWDLDATGHDHTNLFTALDNEGVSPSAKPTDTPSRSRPINVFDAADWTAQEVLDALGLVRLDTGEDV